MNKIFSILAGQFRSPAGDAAGRKISGLPTAIAGPERRVRRRHAPDFSRDAAGARSPEFQRDRAMYQAIISSSGRFAAGA